MIVSTKLDAIRKVRQFGFNVQVVKNDETGRMELIPGAGLKEAKDLVEAICDMAVQEFIAGRVEELRRILHYEPMQRS